MSSVRRSCIATTVIRDYSIARQDRFSRRGSIRTWKERKKPVADQRMMSCDTASLSVWFWYIGSSKTWSESQVMESMDGSTHWKIGFGIWNVPSSSCFPCMAISVMDRQSLCSFVYQKGLPPRWKLPVFFSSLFSAKNPITSIYFSKSYSSKH